MRARRTRSTLASVLAVLAAACLLGALVAGYARSALFSSDGFSERATAALGDDAVRAEIAHRVTDDLVLNANADLVAVRPVIESAVEGLIGAGVLQNLFHKAVRDMHSAFFEANQDSVTLTLADVGEVVRGALQALRPQLSKQVGADVDIEIAPIEPPAWFTELAQAGHDLTWTAIVLVVFALILLVASAWLAADRRRTLLTLGVAAIVFGVIAAVALGLARSLVLNQISETSTRDAIAAVWDAYLRDLRDALYLFAACGAVVAAAASSLLRPVDVASPLRRAWDWLSRTPEHTWARVLRGLALLALGVLVITHRDTAVDLVALAAGLFITYAGVAELMRLTIAPVDAEDRRAEMRRGGRALIATGIAAGIIVLAGAAFVASGGTQAEDLTIETTGCNGSEELCDRTLDEVAIPATHNAMSAVTNENWLFGQQDAGFPDQLRDGVRGLLIDAHYGQPTKSGRVKTDLSEVGVGERDTYAQTLGPQALDAALRLRDRVVNSPTTGPRQVYLCHRFCELGAIRIVDAFRQFRDFLAANPNEVLVIVIEDYVDPADIEDAVEKSGLIDYVYKGPLDPPPTLQEIIDSGGRAVMMAENDAGHGEIEWYHEAYEGLVRETPYSFNKPEKLIDRRAVRESCKPNRGDEDAPYFLLNHWIDTTPAPRPSNALKVNKRDVLMNRIERCERMRNARMGLVAVDFYGRGDLFEVVDELNERPPDE